MLSFSVFLSSLLLATVPSPIRTPNKLAQSSDPQPSEKKREVSANVNEPLLSNVKLPEVLSKLEILEENNASGLSQRPIQPIQPIQRLLQLHREQEELNKGIVNPEEKRKKIEQEANAVKLSTNIAVPSESVTNEDHDDSSSSKQKPPSSENKPIYPPYDSDLVNPLQSFIVTRKPPVPVYDLRTLTRTPGYRTVTLSQQNSDPVNPLAGFIGSQRPQKQVHDVRTVTPVYRSDTTVSTTPPLIKYQPIIPKEDKFFSDWKTHPFHTAVPGTSTYTADIDEMCRCRQYDLEKLASVLTNSFELYNMGFYSKQKARRCYNYCTSRTPTFTSKPFTGEPATHNNIEFYTVPYDSTSNPYERHHCYQRMVEKAVFKICAQNYRPTSSSPQPSRKPIGLNVWTCCRRILFKPYYYN